MSFEERRQMVEAVLQRKQSNTTLTTKVVEETKQVDTLPTAAATIYQCQCNKTTAANQVLRSSQEQEQQRKKTDTQKTLENISECLQTLEEHMSLANGTQNTLESISESLQTLEEHMSLAEKRANNDGAHNHESLLNALRSVETYAFALRDGFQSEQYSQLACEQVMLAFENSLCEQLPQIVQDLEISGQLQVQSSNQTNTKNTAPTIPVTISLSTLARRPRLLRWLADNREIVRTAIRAVVDNGFPQHHLVDVQCLPHFSLSGFGSVCTGATISLHFCVQ